MTAQTRKEWLAATLTKVKGGEAVTTTVRKLLSQFHAAKRGKHIVASIDRSLKECGLMTWPDFAETYIDGEVEFRLVQSDQPKVVDESKLIASPGDSGNGDPVPRLAQLRAANQSPLKVCRDDSIAHAITQMMLNDFSQLPVMQGDRSPDGYVSWETIGRARARGQAPTFVRDAMERAEILPADTPLFDAVDRITKAGFVLVEGVGRKITGLVTTYDISVQFHELSRPFLLISQIEGHLRTIIGRSFALDDLLKARDPSDPDRNIEGPEDLSFGEYMRLLQDEEGWNKLKTGLDRKSMLERLERVRLIRNDIMHFSPDPIDEEQVRLLDDTARCLRDLSR